MRLLFVTDYPPEELIGGSVRVLYEQCRRLNDRNHEIHILTRHENHRNGFTIPPDFKVWKYAADNGSQQAFYLSTLRNSRELFENISEKIKYDIINFHQPFSAAGIIKSPLSRLIPRIYTCHSLSFEEYISRNNQATSFLQFFTRPLNIYLRKKIEHKVLRQTTHILTLSEFTQDKLSRAYKIPLSKCQIIPGGVDLDRYYPSEHKNEFKLRYKISDKKIVLLTVRNLVPRMGLENLIAAMFMLVKRLPQIHLIIAGDGPLKGTLKSMVNSLNLDQFIDIAGFVPESELPDYYRMADLFILPTKELEGFGLITLEAMATGLPVLGTPVGGTREILKGFDQKFLFKDTRPESMASLILDTCNQIINDSKAWMKLSHKCRRYAEKNYSWEKNVTALEKVFMRIKR